MGGGTMRLQSEKHSVKKVSEGESGKWSENEKTDETRAGDKITDSR